jgi:MFS family permease
VGLSRSSAANLSCIAYPLLLVYTTGSVTKAGLIATADMVGGLATGLLGGALADRVFAVFRGRCDNDAVATLIEGRKRCGSKIKVPAL